MSGHELWFWVLAAAIPLSAGAFLCWPLLRGDGEARGMGFMLLVLLPVTTLLLYHGVGSIASLRQAPDPIAAHDAGSVQAMVEELKSRLEQNPDDLEGWMLLGRSYKTFQQPEQARRALEQAYRLAPDDPLVKVEYAEALIYTASREDLDGAPGQRIHDMIESAVTEQPDLQKGLWLLGVLAARSGDDAAAVGYWQRLLPLLTPGSDVEQSVRQQLTEAQVRINGGLPPAPEMAAATAAQPAAQTAISTTVSLDPAIGTPPPGAVLYVIARDPAQPAPPLAVKRIAQPRFPLQIELSDADSMMAQRPLSGASEVELLARLSLSGNPLPQPGDPQSTAIRVQAGDNQEQALVITPP